MAMTYDASDPAQIAVPGPIRSNYDPAEAAMVDVADLGGAYIKTADLAGGTLTLTVQLADNSEGTVAISPTGALAGDTPQFIVLSPTYDAATHRLRVFGLTAVSPSLIFLFIPADIDRDHTTLNVEIGSITAELHDILDREISAADLSPGLLIDILYLSGTMRIVEPLPLRPIDFLVHMYLFDADVSEGPPDYLDSSHALTQSLVDGRHLSHHEHRGQPATGGFPYRIHDWQDV